MKEQVLIIGGGVVGLSASLFLAQHGVSSVLVERHPSTSIHPRARGVNGRSMELYRSLGLEESLREAGKAIGLSLGFISGKTLVSALEANGYPGPLGRWIRRKSAQGGPNRFSPVTGCRITQDLLEPILLESARAKGVEILFSTQAEIVEGTRCVLTDRTTGSTREIDARFIIAADGAKGRVREQLGISSSGAGALTHQLNIYFRADLHELVRRREFSMCLVENGGTRAMFASINNRDLWVVHLAYDPATAPEFTPEYCTEVVRTAVGISDLAVEIKGALPWQSIVRVANSYRSGNIFLAGDSAHLMPPWGGFGANTGVQDAHNLAWKIACVMQGKARESLLDTYFTERRELANTVAHIAGALNDERGLMRGKGIGVFWQMRRVFPYLTLGYGYDSTAIIADPSLPRCGPQTRALDGRPGTRAPHIWLDQSNTTSSLDLFGKEFVLLLGPRAVDVSGDFKVHRVENERDWKRASSVSPHGALLVRPDGFVAWRTSDRPVDAPDAMQRILHGQGSDPVIVPVAFQAYFSQLYQK